MLEENAKMRAFLGLFVALVVGAPALSATIDFKSGPDERESIRLDGAIVDGDMNRLVQLISNDPVRFLGASRIELNSPGGSVLEALTIAEIIDDAALSAIVLEEDICGSSCAYIWIASPQRVSLGKVLIHRPYLESSIYESTELNESGEKQRKVMATVREIMQERNFPSRLIDEMMNRSSRDAYELTFEDILEFGYLSADFEEATIAQCGVSGKDAFAQKVTKEGWNCVNGMRDVQRFRLLFKIIGPDLAKKAGREFILSKGGIENPDGTLSLPSE